jgi:hypothetical protein
MLISGRNVSHSKWLKVFKARLSWSEILIICLAAVVLQLIFASNGIAADPVDPAAGKGIATGLEKAWVTLFTGNGTGAGSFFGTLANTFKGIGIIALVMQTTFILFKMMGSENSSSAKEFARSHIVERLLPNALVIILLANNGINGGNAILTMKQIFFAWDKVAYTTMTDIATTLNQQPQIQGEKEAVEIIKQAFDTCITIPAKIAGEDNPALAECLTGVKQLVDENIANGKIKNKATVEQINNAVSSTIFSSIPGAGAGTELIKVGAKLAGILGASVDKLDPVKLFVESIGLIYNTCIEIALMLTCLSLPLVLMLSLYKFKVFLKWAPQILNLFVAKISYTIACGLVLFVKANAGSDFGMWGYSILLGLGAPIISIFVSLGLSGSMGAVFEREAAKAGAAGVRMAGGGIGAGIRAAGTVAGSPAIGAVAGAAAGKTIEVIARRV